ncbi:MAG: hypothetical protein O9277_02875 [Magnetospirillum sp.]|nr:hypothetical protein [Magnetospirillum sp.]
MNVDKFAKFDRHYLMYWAVIEHYRTWIKDDAPVFGALKAARDLNLAIVRGIAKTYQVERTLRPTPRSTKSGQKAPADKAGKTMARLLNNLSSKKNWPKSLTDRADACLALAQSSRFPAAEGKTPYSAISKMMWFRRPLGWTMFDRLASKGIGLGGPPSEEKFKRFYGRLDCANFQETATDIQLILRRRKLGNLFGERVIDKYLMLVGDEAEKKEASIWYTNSVWVRAVPLHQREGVLEAASEIERLPSVEKFVGHVKGWN